MLICLLTYVGSDFMAIWRSAFWAKNGPKFGKKWTKVWQKIQCFDKDFEKNDLQIDTSSSLFDRFTWKFAQRYFSTLQEIQWEPIFKFYIFALFIAQKPAKWGFSLFLELWRAKNSQKTKIQKCAPIKFFAPLRIPLCKLSSKMVKWSQRSRALKGFCLNFGQNIASLVHFCSNSWPSNVHQI